MRVHGRDTEGYIRCGRDSRGEPWSSHRPLITCEDCQAIRVYKVQHRYRRRWWRTLAFFDTYREANALARRIRGARVGAA